MVEIISPSTARRDRELKRRLYQNKGVPCYWLVDPDAQTVTVYELLDGRYREAGRYHEEVELRLGALEARVDLTKVW